MSLKQLSYYLSILLLGKKMSKINTIKIYKSITEKLTALFPEKTVQIKDIKNIERPCLYVRFVTEKTTNHSKIENSQQSFEIIYFAEENKLLELLQIKESLNDFLSCPITVENKEIEPLDVTITTNEDDYYLQASFDFEIEQLIEPVDDRPLMQILRYKNEDFE